jgi:methylated-DNA-protein-cysteine methyltransferase-like protein
VTDFETSVEAVLRALRPGDVVTYGEVAMEAGFPGAARAVGTILARSGGEFAWWRVVRAGGRLVPGHEAEQARRLRAEGVTVVDNRVREGPPAGGRRALP